eukprot:TRINITY_DN1856_c0_g1_i1.p1 TRINITY_DN1856_c0_g1~~TRINITY_DN1856_c0_g1_i1.p1  ORF type:complete len:193 (-),score=47.50 TRINITY_DN1856_c0_g1_i1:70-648(-)
METISNTQEIISQSKQKLDQMSEFSKSMEQSAKTVMRDNMHRSLTKQLIDSVGAFNAYHAMFQKFTDEKLSREIRIVNPEIKDEEIEDIKKKLANGEVGGSIFAQTFVSEEHTKAREKLRYYRELYKDVIELEKQIAQLKQFFIDASILVAQQGDLINQIEHNVTKSLHYVKKGNKELAQAVQRSQKTCNIF